MTERKYEVTELGEVVLTSGRRIRFEHKYVDGRSSLRLVSSRDWDDGEKALSITIPDAFVVDLVRAIEQFTARADELDGQRARQHDLERRERRQEHLRAVKEFARDGHFARRRRSR